MTEPTYYVEYDILFEPVEVKQSDDKSAEVDVNNKLINYMVSKLFVLEFLTVKAAQQVTVSHSSLLFVVYSVSLQNNSDLEYMKIKTSPLMPIGVNAPYVCTHANLVTPYGIIGGSEYNIGEINECLKFEN